MTLRDDEHAVLADGELTVLGRIRSASNATFLCESTLGLRSLHCVYKPVSGERPLWDFPDGTLAGRELSAYLVSTQLGWNLVPHTIIRDGPAGIGMLQLWVQQPGDAVDSDPLPGPGDEVVLMHADDIRLRRMAVFDVLINNADRKGGHILCGIDGQVYGVDHGLCLHVENKLRTVLWGWAGKPIDDQILQAVAGLADALGGPLAEALAGRIAAAEIGALRRRAQSLLDQPVMPGPNGHRPIPWPAF